MACRDATGIRLLTRNGTDFTARYPLIVEAVEALPVRSCVIDGEAVACNGDGLSIFEKLRWRHHDERVFMWCFDLLVLDGQDLRREPIEVRKATLASCCAVSRWPSVQPALTAPRRHRLRANDRRVSGRARGSSSGTN
jgi:bifunctional non-homologous end joining protein LigD